jgi:hypothetical protein
LIIFFGVDIGLSFFTIFCFFSVSSLSLFLLSNSLLLLFSFLSFSLFIEGIIDVFFFSGLFSDLITFFSASLILFFLFFFLLFKSIFCVLSSSSGSSLIVLL